MSLVRSSLCCLACLLLVGCAPSALPPFSILESREGENPAEEMARLRCAALFPRGSWQLVHAIDYRVGQSGQGSVIGVTSLGRQELECALVTVEGLTLFAARQGPAGELTVSRAVPPFDAPGFAQGLMADLRTLFRRPRAGQVLVGRLQRPTGPGRSGAEPLASCRYLEPGGRVVDLSPGAEGGWRLQSYSPTAALERTIRAADCTLVGVTPIAGTLELTAPGPGGYQLNLKLLRAEMF
ncbi:hypothetical protein [Desulfogranum mediterraneum]|uniref:hypothetical protein n=1 Tax=Desulfogranum mediterraneum TaxID=160661 RepID=UPI0004013AB0|nr:hypothetical protein [Desulfogranum mediterraneum]